MSATPPTIDPETLLQQLSADQISERLRQIERDRRALMVLLRAARARERPRHAPPPTTERGAAS